MLRLIEEGRQDPDQVTELLIQGIDDCLGSNDSVSQAYQVDWLRLSRGEIGHSGTGDNDVYYNRERKYESPLVEYQRLSLVVYSSFYILANIDELRTPNLLAQWIRKDKPRGYGCRDMDIWLIDSYFRLAGNTGEAGGRHTTLSAGSSISGPTVRQSRWNALWDVHHPLLAARKVDLSDIQTIDVLEIPTRLPGALSDSTKEQIVANFLAHADSR